MVLKSDLLKKLKNTVVFALFTLLHLKYLFAQIKKMLSANLESPYNIECILNDTDVKGTLTRDQFEVLCIPLLERILQPVKEGISWIYLLL